MNIKKYGLLLSLLSIAPLSFAATEPVDAEGDSDGETIVVTATRTSETIDETLAPVTVFTREDIEASQAQTIPELLQSIPGVQFSQLGSRGALTSMYIRGTNSNQSLVLIDGVRSGNQNGTSDIQYLDLNQVERIEVVRGSRSSLYGADAIGGVIQIFTKKGSKTQTFAPSVKVGSGSHAAFEGSASVGGTVENTQYSATSSYERTNGYDTTDGTSSSAFDNDDDAFRNASESLNVTQNFTEKTSLNLIYNHSSGAVQYDDAGFPPFLPPVENTHQDFDVEKVSSVFKTAVNDIWNSTLQAAQFKNDQNNTDSFGDSIFNTKRQSANWQNDISIGDAQLLTVGVDYYEDKGEVYVSSSFTPEQNVSFDNTAFFAQDQFSLGKNDFILGLRHDDNSEYGEHDTGDLSWGRNLTRDVRMTASFGKGFRAPTINDLYYPGYSNPNLDPEKSKSYEIGLKGDEHSFNWEANVYQIDVKNLIAAGPAFVPANVEKAQIQGLELAANTTISEWRLGSNVTFLNPRNESTGDDLILRSKRVLTINADRSLGKFDVGASFIAKSHSLYFSNETVAGYGTVDVRGTYHVNDEVDLQLKVNNIFDKQYEVTRDPTFGYGNQYADGVNAFLTVTYTPSVK